MSFFLVFCGVIALVHAYLGHGLITRTRLPRPFNVLAWLACIALAASIPATFVLLSRHTAMEAFWFSFVAYSWLGCSFYLFTFLLAADLSRGISALSKLAARRAAPAPAPDPARRVFLARAVAGSATLATVGLAGLGMRSALGEITTPEVTVRLARLPRELDGFRIVQLSDVHIGPLLGTRFLRHVVEQANALRPDLIAITGDLVDGSVAQLRSSVELLGKLRSRHGTYFVTGNHEYYSGCDEWVVFLERLGVRVLMNERVSIGDGEAGASFDLLGVPDYHAGRVHPIAADAAAAARGRDPERELVVLAHQPVQIEQAAGVGAGLHLAGHTHGGQLQPFGQLVSLVQPYVAGLHRHGDTQIYVSRGTGFWGPPMRVLAPAEITSIRLVRA